MISRVPSVLPPTPHFGRARLLFAATASLACLVLPTAAHAYVLNGHTWAAGSNVVMQLSLGDAPVTMIDGNISRNAAVVPALDMWNQQMARLHLDGVMNSTAPVASGDRVNSVSFSTSVFGQAFGTGTLAVTYYIMQGSNMVEADVLFNVAQNFNSYRGPLQFGSNGYAIGDLRRVFLHEMGHAIGLNHSSIGTIMEATTSDRETLAPDDIAGAQAMYGAPAPVPTPTPTPAPTPVRGSHVRGDFNADGKPDLIWQNAVTGQRAIWIMDGTNWVGERYLPPVTTDWQIAATGDFNGDGQTDIVWQNSLTGQRAIWIMDGANWVGERYLPTVSTDWQIAATGDFNGDGQTDIVWQNTVTGQRAIWIMNGATWVGERFLPPVTTDWQIAATGDFNGDGQTDIVWQNTLTGQRAIWLMNGTTWVGERFLPTVPIDWEIVAAGDYTGDGQTDLVWQNRTSGQRAIWLMNGSSFGGERFLPVVATQWQIRNH